MHNFFFHLLNISLVCTFVSLDVYARMHARGNKNAEKMAVITRVIGVKIAVKTGPFFSIVQTCSQYVMPVTITPCRDNFTVS